MGRPADAYAGNRSFAGAMQGVNACRRSQHFERRKRVVQKGTKSHGHVYCFQEELVLNASLNTNGRHPPAAVIDPIVAIRDLTVRYGAFVAVDGIDLAVAPGEVFGLLGPNGAGKSSTIRVLVTLLLPGAGTATVGGYDVVRQADAVRRLIGYVPQAL